MGRILILPEVYREVNTGGPLAVIKKINLLDKNQYFDYLHKDEIIHRTDVQKLGFLGKFKKNGFIQIISKSFLFFLLYIKIRKVKHKTIISHCPYHSFVISKFFSKIKLINIYHGQGNIYNEMLELDGVKGNGFLKKFVTCIEKSIYGKSYKLGFPSQGSIDALLDTNPALKQILEKRNSDIVFLPNSVDPKKVIIEEEESIKNIIEQNKEKIIISTVSSLNYAKGVDQIPQMLSLLKKSGIDFLWILIGNGGMESKIRKEISTYKLEDNFYAITKGLPKTNVMYLFQQSDFYLMLHRISIFDYATLEAMTLKTVPILSNIGGNKDILAKGGAINYSKETIVKEFNEKIDQLSFLKEKNKKIISDFFSDEQFISNYVKLGKQ